MLTQVWQYTRKAGKETMQRDLHCSSSKRLFSSSRQMLSFSKAAELCL